MKIWIHLNGVQQGPYDLSQISQLPIDANTPVWYAGLPEWTPAGKAPATAPLFQATQPEPQPRVVYVKQPATYTWLAVLLTVICCSPIALLAIITGAISSSRFSSGDYNGAKSMANLTEWLLIFAIVFGVLTAPFALIFWL